MTRLGRVLVVEDEPEVADVLRFSLQRAGADEVVIAGDGHLGVELAWTGAFDLVLCDLMLPGLDGLEVARRLRDHGMVAPLIFVTAAAQDAFRHRKPQVYGAIGAIAKPFDVRKIGAAILAMLEASGISARPG